MTDQVNLHLVWAESGGRTPVSDVKYETGWVVEVPTFQNFNSMLHGLDTNILHYAEYDSFNWDTNISYSIGAKVLRNGTTYTCITANTATDPSSDSTNSYWVTGTSVGSNFTELKQSDGFRVKMPNNPSPGYQGSDMLIENTYPMIELKTASGTKLNLGIRNIDGELALCDLGMNGPDSRTLTITSPNTYRFFHEGHAPIVSEVAGAVPEAPTTGKLYARVGVTAESGNWVEVTSTTVSNTPPQPVIGAGQGWYNLKDGHFYLDINDGNSSQWVIANPPSVPEVRDVDVAYTGANPSLGTTVSEAIDALYAQLNP